VISVNNLILSILAEECAEVSQAVSKIYRFGPDNLNPITKIKNIDKLKEEIADVQGMIKLVTRLGIVKFEQGELDKLIEIRINKTLDSLDLSEKLGLVHH
jgi:NTP pyrophosphatase (non-canonical NTP hydrolase)